MARIRSIHSEQWQDEQFVQCSAFARLLALGIRNHADDNGIFEWKPLTIKMKIFPADNLDVVPLLEEIVAADQVISYEVNGKKYGIIRNFTKYQKPKKPTFIYPVPHQFPTGYELHKEYKPISSEPTKPDSDTSTELPIDDMCDSSPPVPHQFPTNTEGVEKSSVRGREGEKERREGKGREVSKQERAPADISPNARTCLPASPPAGWLEEFQREKGWNKPSAQACWDKFTLNYEGKTNTLIGWKLDWSRWWSKEKPQISDEKTQSKRAGARQA